MLLICDELVGRRDQSRPNRGSAFDRFVSAPRQELRDARIRVGLTQAEGAARAGLSQGAWSRLENDGDPRYTLATWDRAAFAVGTTLNAYLPETSAADRPRDAVTAEGAGAGHRDGQGRRVARTAGTTNRPRGADLKVCRCPAAAAASAAERSGARRDHRLVRGRRRADARLAATTGGSGAPGHRARMVGDQEYAEGLRLLARPRDLVGTGSSSARTRTCFETASPPVAARGWPRSSIRPAACRRTRRPYGCR